MSAHIFVEDGRFPALHEIRTHDDDGVVRPGQFFRFLNVIRGAGDVNFSMIAGVAELAVRMAVAYLLANILNSPTGIWIATPIAWITACVMTVIRYKSGKWKTIDI